MKKIFSLFTGFLLILLVAGCGEKNAQVQPVTTNKTSATKIEKSPEDKILVVYFSVPETDDAQNITQEEMQSAVVVNGEVLGNNQYIAQLIQQNTGADIFRIEPVTPYPKNHGEIEQIATQEKQNEALPPILNKIENFDSYKIFFVGHPIWYGDMPRILYSFFKSYNFSGKTIVPFTVSGSGNAVNVVPAIKAIHPDANVVENIFSIKRDVVKNSEKDIKNWLNDLGF